MKAPAGARKNHTNSGGGSTHGMGAKHHLTRLVDPEDLSGDGAPATPQSIRKNHLNDGQGGARGNFGMAAEHHITPQPDTPALPVNVMDTED